MTTYPARPERLTRRDPGQQAGRDMDPRAVGAAIDAAVAAYPGEVDRATLHAALTWCVASLGIPVVPPDDAPGGPGRAEGGGALSGDLETPTGPQNAQEGTNG